MKKIIYLFLCLCFIVSIAACKDDPITEPEPEDEIKFVLDGSVFNNQFVSFNDFFAEQTTVGYIDSLQTTEIKTIAQFNNSPVSFWLRFPNQNTGSYTYNEPNPPQIDYPANDKYFEIKLGNDTLLGGIAIQQINLNISQYDTVGGRIKGNFEGAVYDYSTGTEALVSVENGEFDMKRQF